MELRRALLLFAIVLGVAAIVAALAGSSTQRSERTTATPPPSPGTDRPASARPPVRIRVDGRQAATTQTLPIGRAATVVVSVDEPGEVELAGLGLTGAAEARAPAVFDAFPTRRGRFEVLFTPAGGVRARALGVLISRPAK